MKLRASKFERSYRLLGIAQSRAIFNEMMNSLSEIEQYVKDNSWVLSEAASFVFAEALLNPPEPNDAAKEAAKQYLDSRAECAQSHSAHL
jgi:hypothetical protein